ncbi:MAG: hypothetical protein ACQEQ4_11405, partial [Fibrobacterota bacterium]
MVFAALFIAIIMFNQNRLEAAMDREMELITQSYEEKGELLASLISQISPVAMMSMDQYTLRTYASELLQDDDVAKVEFLDTTDSKLLSLSAEETNDTMEYILFRKDIKTDPEQLGVELNLGSVQIFFSTHRRDNLQTQARNRLEQTSRRQKVLFSFVFSGILIIVIGALYHLLKKIVIRPIRSGVSILRNLSDEGDLSMDLERAFSSASRTTDMQEFADAVKGIVVSQRTIVSQAHEISRGDWSVRIEERSPRDELAHAMNDMVLQVRTALGRITTAVAQVNSGSAQISEASQDLSEGATSSAANLEEIHSSVTEIGSQAKKNAENGAKAHEIAQKTNKNAQ